MSNASMKEVAGASMLNMVANINRIALAFLTSVLASRWLGSHAFGEFSLIFSYTAVLSYILTFGFDSSIPYFIAYYGHRNLGHRSKKLFRFSLYLCVLGGGSTLLLGLAALTVLTRNPSWSHLFWPVLLMLGHTVPTALSSICSGLLKGIKIFVPTILREQILFPVLHLVSLIVFVKICATGLTGYTLGYFASSLLAFGYLGLVTKKYSKKFFQNISAGSSAHNRSVHIGSNDELLPSEILVDQYPTPKKWFTFSLPLGLTNALDSIIVSATIIYTGWHLLPKDVGIYQASLRLTLFVQFLAIAIIPIFSPYIAAVFQKRNTIELRNHYQQVVFWSSKWALLFGFLLATNANMMLGIFGADFVSPSSVMCLQIILIGSLMEACFVVAKHSLVMAGYNRLSIVNSVVAITLIAVLSPILIPRYGLPGASLVYALSFFVLNLLRVAQFYYIFKVPPLNLRQLSYLGSLTVIIFMMGYLMPHLGLTSLYQLGFSFVLFTGGLLVVFWSDRNSFLGKILKSRFIPFITRK